ncbi:MAG TPA: cupin domain-containing protein [Nocardioidaceae bacterium]|jgi:quercetin dioxygenase-like cupin family protein
MDVVSIPTLAEDQLTVATAAPSGRSAIRVYGRPTAGLRQTLLALDAGSKLGEHKSPGDASLHCLQGQVTVHAGEASIELRQGDLLALPPQRHDVEAHEPSVLLLTVSLH